MFLSPQLCPLPLNRVPVTSTLLPLPLTVPVTLTVCPCHLNCVPSHQLCPLNGVPVTLTVFLSPYLCPLCPCHPPPVHRVPVALSPAISGGIQPIPTFFPVAPRNLLPVPRGCTVGVGEPPTKLRVGIASPCPNPETQIPCQDGVPAQGDKASPGWI